MFKSVLSIPGAMINMEPYNTSMEAVMQLTNYLLDNSYPLVLHLAAIAFIILAVGLGVYMAEPASDGKKKL